MCVHVVINILDEVVNAAEDYSSRTGIGSIDMSGPHGAQLLP